MRELKFRVWTYSKTRPRENRYKMIYSGDITEKGQDRALDFPFEVDGTKIRDIMQYIGVKDCLEQEIYEGDIIQRHIDNDLKKNEIGIVEFKNGQFVIKMKDNTYYEISFDAMFSNVVSRYKIIGNKYETPTLREYL